MKLVNTSIKHNTIIGLLISIWGFLFAFFSKPFEHGTMDTEKWIYVSVGYSIIAFICYLIISYYQKYLYGKLASWNSYLEISIYVLFYSLFLVITYAYYKSSIIGGFYSFSKYFIEIIINVILILSPLLFFVRRYVIKLIPVKQGVTITAGTDSNGSGVVAGFSLHDEFESLSRCGLTESQVLYTATVAPSEWMQSNAGKIEIGRRADLVLLNKNPLDAIKNTRAINAVIANGKYLDRMTLDEILVSIKLANNNSRKINIDKFLK